MRNFGFITNWAAGWVKFLLTRTDWDGSNASDESFVVFPLVNSYWWRCTGVVGFVFPLSGLGTRRIPIALRMALMAFFWEQSQKGRQSFDLRSGFELHVFRLHNLLNRRIFLIAMTCTATIFVTWQFIRFSEQIRSGRRRCRGKWRAYSQWLGGFWGGDRKRVDCLRVAGVSG